MSRRIIIAGIVSGQLSRGNGEFKGALPLRLRGNTVLNANYGHVARLHASRDWLSQSA